MVMRRQYKLNATSNHDGRRLHATPNKTLHGGPAWLHVIQALDSKTVPTVMTWQQQGEEDIHKQQLVLAAVCSGAAEEVLSHRNNVSAVRCIKWQKWQRWPDLAG